MPDRELAALASELVAIDSANPALIAGAAGEAEIAKFVAAWSERAGLEVEVVEPVAGRPSVIATARGTGDGRRLLLNAHLDTVGFAGMERPLDPRIEGDRLYGRGSYDMKGALAAILSVASAAASEGLAGDLIVTAVADEEVASLGTEAVLKQVHADGAVVVEPTELQVAIAHKGFAGFEIETAGVAAHGSRPDLGVDAIALMGPVLVRLTELDRRLRSEPSHPLLASGSLHASLIEGGQEFSSYPARCLLTGERRTIPGESAAQVERELREAAGEAQLRLLVARGPVRGRRGRGDRQARSQPFRHRARRRAVLDRRGARRRGGDPDGALRPGGRGCARRRRMGRPGVRRAGAGRPARRCAGVLPAAFLSRL